MGVSWVEGQRSCKLRVFGLVILEDIIWETTITNHFFFGKLTYRPSSYASTFSIHPSFLISVGLTTIVSPVRVIFCRTMLEKVNLPVKLLTTFGWRAEGHEGGHFGEFSKQAKARWFKQIFYLEDFSDLTNVLLK